MDHGRCATLPSGRRIAVAHGTSVDVFGLQGDASAPSVQLQSTLRLDAPVWHVEFNRLGTCLATATEDNQVTVWRPDLVGDWVNMCTVHGNPIV